MPEIPAYLSGYEAKYASSPRDAAREWFRNTRYGLFLHYGLYSIRATHEWAQLREKIPVAQYAKLADEFTAEKFDARAIVDFAIDCGMKYINITTRHHESFCLWDTTQTDFNTVKTAAKRDLLKELSDACHERGMALFFYYSHGRDWRHSHAPNNDEWGSGARPEYDTPEPMYATGDKHDLQKYLDFMTAQVTELLTGYGPIAGIWLDGIGVPLSGDSSKFKCQDLYDHIHSLQPQTLVSYKQGLLYTEDFFAPEHEATEAVDGKPLEVCTTMCPGSWGYSRENAGTHKNAKEVWAELAKAGKNGYNLLLNTGPLPDGSLDPEDEKVLREVGARIRSEGLPA